MTEPAGTTVATTTLTVDRVNDAPLPEIDPETSNGTVAQSGSGIAPDPIFTFTPELAGEVADLTETDVLDALAEGTSAAELGLISVQDLLGQLSIQDIEQSDFGIGVISANEAFGT